MILIHHFELSNTCFARQTEQDGRFDNGKAKLGGMSALIYGRFYIAENISITDKINRCAAKISDGH